MAVDEEAIIRAAMALAYDEDIQLNTDVAERWGQLSHEVREDYIAKAGTAIYAFVAAKSDN